MTSNALFSEDKIKIEARYCAKMITGMLYPRTTENKLIIFIKINLFFLDNSIGRFK
jgi:hypothetical protein